jgi:hypothetical protein
VGRFLNKISISPHLQGKPVKRKEKKRKQAKGPTNTLKKTSGATHARQRLAANRGRQAGGNSTELLLLQEWEGKARAAKSQQGTDQRSDKEGICCRKLGQREHLVKLRSCSLVTPMLENASVSFLPNVPPEEKDRTSTLLLILPRPRPTSCFQPF